MQENHSGVRPIAFLAVVPITLLFLAIFLDRFVLVPLLVGRLAAPALAAALEAVAIVGCGFLARRLVSRLLGGTARATPALDFLVGYPIFGALCFLIALVRASRATVPLPLAAAFAGIYAIWIAWRSDVRRPIELSLSGALCVAFLGIILALAFVEAQAPATSLDELAYHLAVPRIWLSEGRAIDLPLLSHSYFPLGTESADLPWLALLGTSGAIASHLLHLIAAICTTIVLFAWIRSETSDRAALLVTAAIASTPALAITAGWSLTEWPLVGICVATVMGIERVVEGDDRDKGALLATAIGAGLLTKYTFAAFALVALTTAVLVVRRRKLPARPLLLAVAVGAAIGSIFFIRNAVLTGNPIAPFLSADAPTVTAYRVTAGIGGYAFDPQFIDESLGAALMALALCALFNARSSSRSLIGAALAVAALLLALSSPSSRILVPFLAIPAGVAAKILDPPQRWMRQATAAILGVAIVAQLLLVAFLVDRGDTFSLLSGRRSDEQYAASSRTSYSVAAEIDRVLPPESRTLVIGLGELFPFAHRVRGGGNFDGERMSHFLARPDLGGRLRRDGITHIAVVRLPPSAAADIRKQAERNPALSDAAVASVNGVVSRSQIVMRSDRVLLVALQ
jgi:hypothetical protein